MPAARAEHRGIGGQPLDVQPFREVLQPIVQSTLGLGMQPDLSKSWGLPMSHHSSTSIATRNTLLLLLACAGGSVDAVSYLELGRVFTANMTGNTVLLGLALVQAESQAAVQSAVALAGFLVGGAFGAWIIERRQLRGMWPPTVTLALTLEWIILVVFAVGWQCASAASPTPAVGAALIVLSALAMGVQSAAARRLDVSGITTTYITGTLTSLITGLVCRVGGIGVRRTPAPPPQRRHGAGLLAAVWLVYLGGAVIAAAVTVVDRALAVVFPIAVVTSVIITAAIRFGRR
jgi:uncharacterized membrane protein YoaK (UPF0700 family)